MTVCAVIVTYQPYLSEVQSSLAKLRPQVDAIVLVDNASLGPLREGLRGLAVEFRCHLIENAANLGIAEALNQAVRYASAQHAKFVLFFDQDSGTSPDFVTQQLACYRAASQHARVGLVAPTILLRSDHTRARPVCLRNGRIILAQTSGALMPLAVFDDVGLFRADLFIDYVDYEHCLRMFTKGWQIAYAEAAELDHMPGNGTSVQFLGRTIHTVGAAPLRHYYETRNCLWVVTHHFRSSPEMTTRLLLRMVYTHLRALLLEPDRRAKLTAGLQGAFDALRGRLGVCRDEA